MKDATRKLNELGVKLGSSVEKSRVYYDVREKAKEVSSPNDKQSLKTYICFNISCTVGTPHILISMV